MKVTHHRLSADVVIAGGGMAGTCAAIAAARNGAQVILVQNRPVLGGNASSEVRMHMVGANCSGARRDIDSRESGIIEELRLEEAVRNPQRSFHVWDLLLYEWVRRERRIALLLNTEVYGVRMDGERIVEAHASRGSTEDAFVLEAPIFVDATGDGRLGYEAGALYRVGREGRDEYGESLAVPVSDNKVLGSTILFTARKHDRPMPFQPPPWARRFERCEDLPHRKHEPYEYGFWWLEWGGHLDTIKENERIRDELLAIALGIWDHIKNRGDHGADNWALEWVGAIPGKRESRRFLGDYVLHQRDLQEPTPFFDEVAYGGWFIDTHPPEGIDSPDRPCTQHYLRELFGIPLRCLYSRNVSNLFMAGRNISATHIAFASTRVMATCAVMGQAVGTAAARCAARGLTPRELVYSSDLAVVQQQLLKDDAYLLHQVNQDPADLARQASVQASSEVPTGEAANVVNGVARMTRSGQNRWISAPSGGPAWLELRFPQPTDVREIHLTFDTNLQGVLTLTASDWYNDQMVRGPQPETVRDYTVSLISHGMVRPVDEVTGNYQRKRVHRFEPVPAEGIRLDVRATNGDRSVRVFEIRAY